MGVVQTALTESCIAEVVVYWLAIVSTFITNDIGLTWPVNCKTGLSHINKLRYASTLTVKTVVIVPLKIKWFIERVMICVHLNINIIEW